MRITENEGGNYYSWMKGKCNMPIVQYIASTGGCAVRNVKDTDDEPIPSGYKSVLDYWEKIVGKKAPKKCFSVDPHINADGEDSDKSDIVGAHVRVDGMYCPKDWAWIVPLCKHCNNDAHTEAIHLPAGTILVPIQMEKEHETVSDEMVSYVRDYDRYFGNK